MKVFNNLARFMGLATPPAHVAVVPTNNSTGKSPTVPVATTSSTKNSNVNIAIVNASTVLTDAQIAAVVPALQTQVTRDFQPVWNLGANLIFVPKGHALPNETWIIYIMDHSDQQGALGYHETNNSEVPIAKVFVADDMQYHLSWTVTLSHELLEMLLDPYINDTVFVQQSDTTGVLFALEACDGVEDDSFGYQINGVLVSDFVYPAWFEAGRAANSTKFSYGNHVHAPFQIATGGYIGYFIVSSSTSGWQQSTADGVPGQRLASKLDRSYSRLAKRYNNTSFATLPDLKPIKKD